MSSLKVFGHPVHPLLSDLPIPLLGTSLLWDGLGWMTGAPLWWAIGFWNIALGLAFSALTATTGLIDYSRIPEQSPAARPATAHMWLMLGAVTSYAASLVIRHTPAPPGGGALIAAVALEAAGLALLGGGGWFGGELVFKHGLGIDAADIKKESDSFFSP